MKTFINRYPAATYFITCFIISWVAAFVLIAPKLLNHQPLARLDGILMFPLLLTGPLFASIILTSYLKGKAGLRQLFSGMGRFKVKASWYLPLLIPPVAIFAVLAVLRLFVSPAFTPQFFAFGVLFAVPAGLFEEIGWTGFAFPALQKKFSALKASVILGIFWGLWHLPVIDFLGAANPHGVYWLPFVCVFIGFVWAMRVLIAWIFCNTKSLILCQLMHISSTGFLVILGSPHVSAAQETLWYGIYASVLWAIVAVVRMVYGKNLKKPEGGLLHYG